MTEKTSANNDIATLGGGCFWCLEAVYDELEGVLHVESGYSGGTAANPTYRQVCAGTTGHAVRLAGHIEQLPRSTNILLDAAAVVVEFRHIAATYRFSGVTDLPEVSNSLGRLTRVGEPESKRIAGRHVSKLALCDAFDEILHILSWRCVARKRQ